jgi:uncharacterized protein YkwD
MSLKLRFALLLLAIGVVFSVGASTKKLSRDQIIELVNTDRTEHGLSMLKTNSILDLAAFAKAQDMLSKNYFAHVSPDGISPWHWFRVLGYNYSFAGENLAEGFSDPEDLESSWMASPTHRANILSPNYSDVGLAVVTLNNTNIVVELFGTKDNQVSLRK